MGDSSKWVVLKCYGYSYKEFIRISTQFIPKECKLKGSLYRDWRHFKTSLWLRSIPSNDILLLIMSICQAWDASTKYGECKKKNDEKVNKPQLNRSIAGKSRQNLKKEMQIA